MSKIIGKLAVVTGATSGIGEATAIALAAKKARVVLVGRREERLAEVSDVICKAGGEAIGIRADLTDSDQVRHLKEKVDRDVGTPDLIVNSAGAGAWRYLDEADADELRGMLESPVLAAMLVNRAFLPAMVDRGSGHLVHVTSLAGWFAWPGATAYTAARWAMRGLHEALVADLRGTGVRATLATFAKVASSYWESNPGSEERVPRAQTMIGILTPQQAARSIVRGVRWNLRHIIAPFELRLIMMQSYLLPGFTPWLIRVTGHRRRP